MLCDVETGKKVCLAYTFDFDKGDDRLDGDLAKMVDDGRMRMAHAEISETRFWLMSDVSAHGTVWVDLIREGFWLIVTAKEWR